MFIDQIINSIENINDRSPGMLIFFVTSRCNARCPHCFNWKNINKKSRDLTLKEIEKLSLSMPRFKILLFSGGEPFLRTDLFEIVKLFYQNSGVREFIFPTNGSLSQKINKDVFKMLNFMPDAQININFSIDGTGDYHDAKRSIPGCFSLIENSIKNLRLLRHKFKDKLIIKTNTVIMPDNLAQIPKLITYFENKHSDLDDNLFEIIRGSPKDDCLKTEISKKDLLNIYNLVQEHRLRKLISEKKSNLEIIFRLANLILIQDTQLHAYFKKGWGTPCLAGQTIGVIDHNGFLRHCELREPVVNLHSYNMNFLKGWNSAGSIEERRKINKEKCWTNCTHICYLTDSLFRHKRTLLLKVPLSLIKSAFKTFSFMNNVKSLEF